MQRLLGVWFCNNYYVAIANSGSVRTLVYFFLICSSPSTDKSSILQPWSIHAVQRPVYNFAELWSRKNLKACRHLLWTDTRWFTKLFEHNTNATNLRQYRKNLCAKRLKWQFVIRKLHLNFSVFIGHLQAKNRAEYT